MRDLDGVSKAAKAADEPDSPQRAGKPQNPIAKKKPRPILVGVLLALGSSTHRRHESLEPSRRARVQSRPQRSSLGKAQAEEGPMKTVLIYVNTSAEVGDVDHLKVFANEEAAEKWFEENDPEGVAFEYEVLE
jgi:hypothetical protein